MLPSLNISLVEAIEDQLSQAAVNSKQGSQPKHPCNVTLLTTDTTFLVESDDESHANGLETFWKRTRVMSLLDRKGYSTRRSSRD